MQIVYKKIKDLIPYEKNPRNNDDAVEYVSNSIKEFGFKVPIIIDKNNVIVAGHTRYKASKKLNLDEVPCIIADDLTDEQIKAFRLADNKTSEIASWDFDLLEQELADLVNFDMSNFGFDILEEETSVEDVIEDEYDADDTYPVEPKTKLGDMYRLGKHYLLCGDSTNIDTVRQLVQENEMDLLLTDPPYNVNVENSNGLKIKNDNMDSDSFRAFLSSAFKCANEVMKPSMLDMYSDQCEEIKKKIEEISERIVKMNEAMTSSDFRNLGLTEAYHIGPAYFKKLDPQNLEESLREVFDNNVVSILREYLRGRRKDEVDKLINTCKKNLFPEEKSSGEN